MSSVVMRQYLSAAMVLLYGQYRVCYSQINKEKSIVSAQVILRVTCEAPSWYYSKHLSRFITCTLEKYVQENRKVNY